MVVIAPTIPKPTTTFQVVQRYGMKAATKPITMDAQNT